MRKFDGGLTRSQSLCLVALYGVTAVLMVLLRPYVLEMPVPWLELIATVSVSTAMAAAALLTGLFILMTRLRITAHQRPGTVANVLFLLLAAILLCSFALPVNLMLMADLGTTTLNDFEIGPGRLRDVLSIPFWLLLLLLNGLALAFLCSAGTALLRLCVGRGAR